VEKEGGSVIHPTSEVPSNFSAAVAPMETKYFISVRLSVCVCLCLSASISQELLVQSSPNFVRAYYHYLWPWIGPPLTVLRCVSVGPYFQFYG